MYAVRLHVTYKLQFTFFHSFIQVDKSILTFNQIAANRELSFPLPILHIRKLEAEGYKSVPSRCLEGSVKLLRENGSSYKLST